MQWAPKQKGFTIVELLIVVVVIAILAAITIVAYNGIQNRAKDSSAMTAASQAVKKIEAFKSASTSELYPVTAAEAGIATMTGVTLLSSADKSNYCVQAVNGQFAYSAVKDSTNPVKGTCGENGLIGWWQLNGDGADSTGNGWTASVTATAAQGQNGRAGNALEFNGSIPTATVTGSEGILTPTHTFSFWYYANSWNSAPATSFVAKRAGAANGVFIMRLTTSNTLVVDCAGQNNRWNSGTALPLNAWTHIVVTCSNTLVSAYVNGNPVGSAALTAGSVSSNTQLQFAQDGSQYPLNGRMDDIRLFNRALGQAEAQKLYADGAR